MINIFKIHKYMMALTCPSLAGAGVSTAVSAALSGLGMILQQASADSAARKQQAIINQGAEEDRKLSEKKSDIVQNFAKDNYTPQTRIDNYEQGAANNESSLVSALKAANDANGTGEVKSDVAGNLSADYLHGLGKATVDGTNDIMKRTKLMARGNAYGNLGLRDTTAGANMSADVAGVTGAADRNKGYTRTALNANQNQGSLVGGLLQGIAPMGGDIYKSLTAKAIPVPNIDNWGITV